MKESQKLFDDWAETFDKSLENPTGFPFSGYNEVLAGVVGGSQVGPGSRVLDVGTGTGTLAARFVTLGCHVLGVDASEAMLVRARNKVLDAQFAPLELLESWDALNGWKFDAVVSTYVLHEFDWPTKMKLLTQMVGVLKPGGRIVVGDISFATGAALAAAHAAWESVWDESEHYWIAAEALPLLTGVGFQAHYRQVSFCGGVYRLALAS